MSKSYNILLNYCSAKPAPAEKKAPSSASSSQQQNDALPNAQTPKVSTSTIDQQRTKKLTSKKVISHSRYNPFKMTEVTLPVDTKVAPAEQVLLRFELNQKEVFMIASPEYPITIPQGTTVLMNNRSLCLTVPTLVQGDAILMGGRTVRFSGAPAVAGSKHIFYFLNVINTVVGKENRSLQTTISDADRNMVISDAETNSETIAAPSGRTITPSLLPKAA